MRVITSAALFAMLIGIPAVGQNPITLGLIADLVIAADAADPQNPGSSSSSTDDRRDKVFYPGDTENVVPLAKKLGWNILLDQKDIWTSPFHMHKKDAPWWIGFGAITVALVATDHRTSNLFENSHGQVTWGNNLSKIGAAYTLIPVAAGFYGFGILADNPKARETGILGGEAMLDSLIVVEVLKSIARRERPNSGKEPGEFFDGGASFPSGHAIASWSLASVISYEYGHTKFVPIIACGLAAVVSVARYGAQQHYASDIVAGGAMGWFIGRYVWKTHQDRALHHHSFNPQIIPNVQPGSHTYTVALAFGGSAGY